MTPFPGTQILRPQRITEEMLGEVLDITATPDWVIQTWTYGLDYLDFPFPDDIPRPLYLAGTTLKLKVKYSGQFLCLPSKAFALETPSFGPTGQPYTGARADVAAGQQRSHSGSAFRLCFGLGPRARAGQCGVPADIERPEQQWF